MEGDCESHVPEVSISLPLIFILMHDVTFQHPVIGFVLGMWDFDGPAKAVDEDPDT